jgi:hypothetical protein
MSTAKFNTWLNPDGTQNYKCRAWVNFNGTGTVAIRASGNVSSIVDNGTGDYTVNFTTAMPDENYSATVGYVPDGIYPSSAYARLLQIQTINSGNIRLRALYQDGSGGAAIDYPTVNLSVFR